MPPHGCGNALTSSFSQRPSVAKAEAKLILRPPPPTRLCRHLRHRAVLAWQFRCHVHHPPSGAVPATNKISSHIRGSTFGLPCRMQRTLNHPHRIIFSAIEQNFAVALPSCDGVLRRLWQWWQQAERAGAYLILCSRSRCNAELIRKRRMRPVSSCLLPKVKSQHAMRELGTTNFRDNHEPHHSLTEQLAVGRWPVALLLLPGSDVTKHILGSGYDSRSLSCSLKVEGSGIPFSPEGPDRPAPSFLSDFFLPGMGVVWRPPGHRPARPSMF